MPSLTEDQRQHILALLEDGQPLPAEYKPLLFPPEWSVDRVSTLLAYPPLWIYHISIITRRE